VITSTATLKDQLKRALQEACFEGRTETAEFLLEIKAEFDPRNKVGTSSLLSFIFFFSSVWVGSGV
jgi:ankyrin repeat protein